MSTPVPFNQIRSPCPAGYPFPPLGERWRVKRAGKGAYLSLSFSSQVSAVRTAGVNNYSMLWKTMNGKGLSITPVSSQLSVFLTARKWIVIRY